MLRSGKYMGLRLTPLKSEFQGSQAVYSWIMQKNTIKTVERKKHLHKVIHVICEKTGSETWTHHSSELMSFWYTISLFSIKKCLTELWGLTLMHLAAVLVLQGCNSSELAWDQSWPPDQSLLLLYLLKRVVYNLDSNTVRFDKWVLTSGLFLIGVSETCCFS